MSHIEVKPSECFIKVLKELASLGDSLSSIKNVENDSSISLTTNDVKWCHQKLKDHGLPYQIYQLLNKSEIILPKYEPPPRSPELEARIKKLKAEQDNKEYYRMTQNLIVDQYKAASLKGLGADVREINIHLREMNRYLVTGAQYITSVVGTFFAIFIGLSYVMNEFGTRALLATFCAVAVALAEIYFIIRQDINQEKEISKKLT